MRSTRSKSLRLAGAGAAVFALLTVAVTGPALAAHQAAKGSRATTVTPGSAYLALGDSVTFGYRESNTVPAPTYSNAASFTGYPEDVGAALGLKVANSSCPGETSLSFVKRGVQSNGCENSPGGGPGYRSVYPLHVRYHGTQLNFALRYLRSHAGTRLVSLMIGANDAFLCQETTKDACASELPQVLKSISTNVARILSAIRHDGRYSGQLVLLNYYSLDYSNSTDNAGSMALNIAMDHAAKKYGAAIADGYGAFRTAALQSGGNSCTAGLLTQLTGGGCGVHPSLAGQAVLALAIEKAIKR